MMHIIRTLFRDGAASVLFMLCELFLRILWIRERRVGIFSSADEVSDGQGLRGPGPRKGHWPLTLFLLPLLLGDSH